MRLRITLAAFIVIASPGFAQTPEVPASATHKPHTAKAAVKHSAAAKPAPHKTVAAKAGAHKTATKPAGKSNMVVSRHPVPVVAPRHGVVTRKPVQKAAPVAVPPKPTPKPAAPAKPPVPADQGTVTGLHLPRYASLKTGDVNMRSGPGARYPVLWDYRRVGLPVRIVREFDVWRLVEDMDGTKGWIHQATLAGRRTFVITGADPRTMRADSSDEAAAVAVLKPGVVGRIKACAASAAWCQVQVGDYKGWLARADFWGTDVGELVAP